MDLNGNKVEGELKPSSDTKTHLELCKAFSALGRHRTHPLDPRSGLCPSAARPARLLARPTPTIYGPCPLHAGADAWRDRRDYEKNTGKVIIETFQNRGIDPVHVPGVLCASHGPFTRATRHRLSYHAVVLEEVARMAILTLDH